MSENFVAGVVNLHGSESSELAPKKMAGEAVIFGYIDLLCEFSNRLSDTKLYHPQ